MNSYLQVFRKYAVFSGRSTRKEYWQFELINSTIVTALLALGYDDGLHRLAGVFTGLNLIYNLVAIVPRTAVSARRLHDTGRSGWWTVIGFVLPSVIFGLELAATVLGSVNIPRLLVYVLILVGLVLVLGDILLLVFMVLDSQAGENRFGPDPKARTKSPG